MSEESKRLIIECKKAEESCMYTSTSFFIWLRILKKIKVSLNVAAVIFGCIATWEYLNKDFATLMALSALLAVILPQVHKVAELDNTIELYSKYAAIFKNLQDKFRRIASVTALGDYNRFSSIADMAFTELDTARMPSLTPPEICFKWAQAKVKSEDYKSDVPEVAEQI